MIINSRVDFYPVGQGLFSYGEVCLNEDASRVYSWVFDCGTSSPQSLVDSAISDIKRRQVAGVPSIDMVCISHFDQDHVSGLVRLLESFRIELLLLPLIPLWRRIGLLTTLPVGRSKMLQDFLVDPTSFATQRARFGLGQIAYFQAGSEDGEPLAGDRLERIEGPEVPVIRPRPRDPEDAQFPADGAERAGARQAPTSVTLKVGGTIQIDDVWEFMPFSDKSPALIVDPAFEDEVRMSAARLVAASTSSDRQTLLAGIKRTYDSKFGPKNHFLKNLMSTFLYCGPLEPNATSYLSFSRFVGNTSTLDGWKFPMTALLLLRPVGGTNGASYLFTGDAYLESASRLTSLCDHLGLNRVASIQCLQVMHHGALGNWHSNVPSVIGAAVSVFSSDPNRKGYRHPDPTVWRSFIAHGREQVDREVGVRFQAVSFV